MEIRYHRFNAITRVKSIFVLFLLSISLAFFVATPAHGVDTSGPADLGHDPQYDSRGLGNAFKTDANSPLDAVAAQGGGFNTSVTFETIVSTIITMVLGLMGVIFLILAIYGGYTWMMAGGNEEAVAKAKKTITNAVIGLIIVLAAYAMSRLIIEVVGNKVFK